MRTYRPLAVSPVYSLVSAVLPVTVLIVVQVVLSFEVAIVKSLPQAASQINLTSPIDCDVPRSRVIQDGSAAVPWTDSQREVVLPSTAFAGVLVVPLVDDAVA